MEIEISSRCPYCLAFTHLNVKDDKASMFVVHGADYVPLRLVAQVKEKPFICNGCKRELKLICRSVNMQCVSA